MATDKDLITEYAEKRSETAFSELAGKYTDLVYSSCFRQLQNTQLAEEASQAVFMILAEKAGSLKEYTSLAGWLVNTARYASLNALKSEMRRKNREKEAADMRFGNTEKQPDWDGLSQYIDEALQGVDPEDRDILVLKYFQDRTYKDVASDTGLSEAAAQKRGSRALDKMKSILEKKGIVLPVTVLSGLLVQNAVQAAPAGLAVLCTAAGTGGAAATAGGSVYSIYKGALFMIVWTKVKIAAFVAGVSILAGAFSGILADQHADAEIRQAEQEREEQKTVLSEKDAELKKLERKIALLQQRKQDVTSDIDHLLAQLDEKDAELTQRENELKDTLRAWALQQEITEQKISELEQDTNGNQREQKHPLLAMMNNPAFREKQLAAKKKKWLSEYKKFYADRNMSESDIEAFINEKARDETEGKAGLLTLVLKPGVKKEDLEKAQFLKEQSERRFEENMKRILGVDGFQAMLEYDRKKKEEQKRKWVENDVEEFSAYLSGTEMKLTEKQEKQVSELFAEKNRSMEQEEEIDIFLNGPEQLEKQLAEKKQHDKRLLDKARSFLSEQQMEKLKEYFADEHESEEAIMNWTLEMLKPMKTEDN